MNFIGKLLALLFFVGAMAALMWATVTFTMPVHWQAPKDAPPAPKGAEKKPAGKVAQVHARIKELDDVNARAVRRWVANSVAITEVEKSRLDRRNYLAARLEIARTGKLNGVDVKSPLREFVVNDDTGLIEIDLEDDGMGQITIGDTFNKRPEYKLRAAALETPVKYLPGIDSTHTDIVKEQSEIKNLIDSHSTATAIINGTQMPFSKGLRVMIKDQVGIEQLALEEYEYLADFITNRRAEAQLFVKRRDSLVARLNELMRLRPPTNAKE